MIIIALVLAVNEGRAQGSNLDGLWGATFSGGDYGAGTIIQLQPNGGGLNYSFSFGANSSGANPFMSNLIEVNGKLYGTTQLGGVGSGVLFEFDPATSQYVVKHSFDKSDGYGSPFGKLVLHSNGKLYGTTYATFSVGGIVFEFDPTSSQFRKVFDVNPLLNLSASIGNVLYASSSLPWINGLDPDADLFDIAFDGTGTGFSTPTGDLFLTSTGKLLGTTSIDGANEMGQIFEFDPADSTLNILYEFSGSDGKYPQGPLAEVDGFIFGSTCCGGTNDRGVFYKFDRSLNTLTVLKNFNGSYGYGLNLASDGKLYGITYGDENEYGLFYRYDPLNDIYEEVFEFDGPTHGVTAMQPPYQHSNGKLYGLTNIGGQGNAGIIYDFDIANSSFNKLYDFNYSVDGSGPRGAPALHSNGKLYGIASSGTNFMGVLYELDAQNNVYTKVLDFDGLSTGDTPSDNLVMVENGKFYGVTKKGGVNSHGILFEYDPIANGFVNRKDFDLTSGAYPSGDLFLAPNGKLYGMTSEGGASNAGVIFEYDTESNTFSKKVDLDPVTIGINGNDISFNRFSETTLIGATSLGAANGFGSIFQFDFVQNTISTLLDFESEFSLQGGLVGHPNGKFYFTSLNGGAFGAGALQEFNPVTGSLKTVRDFNPYFGGEENPLALMLSPCDGILYGMTKANSGSAGIGLVFSYDPDTDLFNHANWFGFFNGLYPQGKLVKVGKDHQVITFDAIPTKAMNDPPFNLIASVSSGKPIDFIAQNGHLLIDGNIATLSTPGREEVLATQAGDEFCYPVSTEQTFCIKPPKPSVTQSVSGGEVMLTSSANSGNQWYFNDTEISGAMAKTYVATLDGGYSVKVTIDDCESEVSETSAVVITGITDEINSKEISTVFPNPTNSSISLKLIDGKASKILAFDALGRQQSIQFIQETEYLKADVQNLSAGPYIMKIFLNDRQITIRFVKY